MSGTHAVGFYPCTHTISSLRPRDRGWKIRAKVVVKDAIKDYNNAGRKGSYFCVRLQDETGEIRGVAFNDVGRKLAEHIEIGKDYLVSSGLVKNANPNYTDDLYDILFDATTIFRPVECTVEAVVVRVFTDLSVSYEACPVSGCNEQVRDEGDGVYRCHRCRLDFDVWKRRTPLPLLVRGPNGHQMIVLGERKKFDSTLFGRSTGEMERLRETQPDGYQTVLQDIVGQVFVFHLRLTTERYDVTRVEPAQRRLNVE